MPGTSGRSLRSRTLYNATVVEDELYAIWRDQIEYDETRYDFDEWMRKVGGDYLKQDVLPYM